MPKMIQDITRRTVIDLTGEQNKMVEAYIKGELNASAAANQLGYDRQRFVNLVFTLLPQWYKENKIIL